MDSDKKLPDLEGKKIKELMQMFRILFFDRVALKKFSNPETYLEQLKALLNKLESFGFTLKYGTNILYGFIESSLINSDLFGEQIPIRSIKVFYQKSYILSFAESIYFLSATKKNGGNILRIYSYPQNSIACQYRVSSNFTELESLFLKPKATIRFSSATASKLQSQEKSQNSNARKILRLLREHFNSIDDYTYEQGNPSHKWSDSVNKLELRYLTQLFDDVITVLKTEPTLLEIESPAYVIGDLHGNYEDLMKFARFFGMWYLEVVPTKFVFLGDYVDRGPHSIETVAFLFALKVLYPNKVFLLRGNHESNDINSDFKTYRDVSLIYQCCSVYDPKVDLPSVAAVSAASSSPGKPPFNRQVLSLISNSQGLTLWNRMNEVFNYLPLTCIIDGKLFCVHGGIPRIVATYSDGNFLSEIKEIPRPIPNVYTSYLLFDLLWADPATADEESSLNTSLFGSNQRGGDTIVFGKNAISKFRHLTGCTHILRAHQSPKHGIDIGKAASTITVFSSSHYCCNTNSAGAVLANDNTINIIVFGDGTQTAIDTQVSVPHK